MAERFKAPVLKTGVLVRVPGVRIPLRPLDFENRPSVRMNFLFQRARKRPSCGTPLHEELLAE